MGIKELEHDFKRRSINFSNPGFFDHPHFVAAERTDASFLERYADYVHLRPYDESYLNQARLVIQRAATHLHAEIKADGRKGACIDASMVLSRILEREGIWNCMMAGAARIDFHSDVGVNPRYFWPIMHEANNARAGHAWLYAPPFRVVDVTIDLQPYMHGEERYLRGPVLDETPAKATYTANDLVEPEAREAFYSDYRREITLEDINQHAPSIAKCISRYGCFVTSQPSARITYVACSSGAPDLPLEKMMCLILRGKPPHVVYDEFKRSTT